jgi:hypothetical protein
MAQPPGETRRGLSARGGGLFPQEVIDAPRLPLAGLTGGGGGERPAAKVHEMRTRRVAVQDLESEEVDCGSCGALGSFGAIGFIWRAGFGSFGERRVGSVRRGRRHKRLGSFGVRASVRSAPDTLGSARGRFPRDVRLSTLSKSVLAQSPLFIIMTGTAHVPRFRGESPGTWAARHADGGRVPDWRTSSHASTH